MPDRPRSPGREVGPLPRQGPFHPLTSKPRHGSKNVGAGLLAKAVCQAPNASTDTQPSRASPLPQLNRSMPDRPRSPGREVGPLPRQGPFHPLTSKPRHGSKNVGAGLLAKALCQALNASADTPPSRASPLPQLNRFMPDRSRSPGREVGPLPRQGPFHPLISKPRHGSKMWERACSRKQCVRHRMHQLTLRLREQARSHS